MARRDAGTAKRDTAASNSCTYASAYSQTLPFDLEDPKDPRTVVGGTSVNPSQSAQILGGSLHDDILGTSPASANLVSDSDSDGYEPATGFEDLVSDIKRILGPTSGLDSAEVDVDTLMDRLAAYDPANVSEWAQYAFSDSGVDYTRNGVDDINSKANLLILVWTPGKGSKIHDHADAHCIVKMLKGTLRESLYRSPEPGCDDFELRRVTDYHTGEVSYMSDTLGLHRMENPGTDFAVSLHLYTPPYAAKFGCNVYDEKGQATKCKSTLYSDHGVRL